MPEMTPQIIVNLQGISEAIVKLSGRSRLLKRHRLQGSPTCMQGAISCTGSSKQSFRLCEHALLPPFMLQSSPSVKLLGPISFL